MLKPFTSLVAGVNGASSEVATSDIITGGIQVRNLDITLGGVEIVHNLSLNIAPGQFVCLLGPSGCGKSTVLNAVAGFLPATRGSILMDDSEITGPGVERGIVFQSTECLFPWLTVRENVEYGLRARGVSRAQRRERVQEFVKLVGLEAAIDRFPGEISGGMQQRTQLARVLANEPDVLLMDEPFAALDAQTRRVMQAEVNRIWRATRATVLFITHDIGEAILLADVIVTMTSGPRAGIRSVREVPFEHPRDLAEEGELSLYRELRAEIENEVSNSLK